MAKWVGVWLVIVLVAASMTYAADVTVNGYVQYQYFTQQIPKGQTGLSTNFLFKAARLKGSLKINDKISAMVYLDGTRQPSVLEANVEYAFAPIAVARLGQFQVPFGYESQNANFDNEAIDRSQVVSALWNNGATAGYLRDAGIMVMGQRKFFSYKVACVNGSGLNTADNNNRKDIVGSSRVSAFLRSAARGRTRRLPRISIATPWASISISIPARCSWRANTSGATAWSARPRASLTATPRAVRPRRACTSRTSSTADTMSWSATG
jgi:hypothetical protein